MDNYPPVSPRYLLAAVPFFSQAIPGFSDFFKPLFVPIVTAESDESKEQLWQPHQLHNY